MVLSLGPEHVCTCPLSQSKDCAFPRCAAAVGLSGPIHLLTVCPGDFLPPWLSRRNSVLSFHCKALTEAERTVLS